MYRIRFHGRGGQGTKTASRIVGTALFLEGFEVQDAPRYGAERRGAPIFAYVRADHNPIHERGIIERPDLVVIVDESLVGIPAAGALSGVDESTVLLIYSDAKAQVWRDQLGRAGKVVTLPAAAARDVMRFVGARCAGAAARLVGVLARATLEKAIRQELAALPGDVIEHNLDVALGAYDLMAPHGGCVQPLGERPPAERQRPEWIEIPFDDARVSAPTIHAAQTSVKAQTGLWRTTRPVIDYDRCHRCAWICSGFCPDSAIGLDKRGFPQIDYEHCKGCMICVAQCPWHAVEDVPEHDPAETPDG